MSIRNRLRDTFTLSRWRTDPFQMYDAALLLLVSLAQLRFGIAPSSPVANLLDNTQQYLSFCNLWGALIVLWGVHLRELEISLWVELSGYFCLIFALTTYVYLLMTTTPLALTTTGFAFSQAFVLASLHRGWQILRYKRARRKKRTITGKVEVLKEVLRTEDHDDV